MESEKSLLDAQMMRTPDFIIKISGTDLSRISIIDFPVQQNHQGTCIKGDCGIFVFVDLQVEGKDMLLVCWSIINVQRAWKKLSTSAGSSAKKIFRPLRWMAKKYFCGRKRIQTMKGVRTTNISVDEAKYICSGLFETFILVRGSTLHFLTTGPHAFLYTYLPFRPSRHMGK